MKIASYSASRWYSVEYEEDGAGTYDLKSATMDVQFEGGPEGITYVPQGSRSFPRNSILIALYQRGTVITAPLDANGNPRMDEAQDVISGLQGAEGAVIDPKTGDFLFSTFGGGNHLVRVTGFQSPDGVAEAYRPSMVRSVPSPADISTEPDVIGTNVTLALVTLLLIFTAAQLLNSTISENKEEIDAMLAPVTRRLRTLTSRLPLRDRRRRRVGVVDATRRAQVAGADSWPDGDDLRLHRSRLRHQRQERGTGAEPADHRWPRHVSDGRRRSVPRAHAIRAGDRCTAVPDRDRHRRWKRDPVPCDRVRAGRDLRLRRGGGIPATVDAHSREAAHIVFLPAVGMLGVSVVAWLLIVPLRALADATDAAVPAFLEGIAVTLFVTGLQGTFFNMVPLSFMDGQKIWRWNKVAWIGLTATTAMLFWHVLINGDQSYLRVLSSTVSAAAFGILIATVAASAGAWLFFHRRHARQPA